MAQQEEELRGKAKLAFEACLKIFHGQKMATEGTFELNNLFGEHSLKKKDELTPGQKSALTKKKLIAHRESSFKKDKRSDETIIEKMIGLVRVNRQASTVLFKKKLHLSERRLNKLLGIIEGKGLLVDEGSGKEGAHHKWVLPKETKPEKKQINGHKLSKTPGGGGKKMKRNSAGYKTIEGSHGQIDVTDEKIAAKAKEFLQTNDWVTKGKLLDVIDLSSSAGNRFITYAKKQKLIKEVHKKNNPAHDKDGLRKFHSRHLPYLELA